jgi:hypothetical protein
MLKAYMGIDPGKDGFITVLITGVGDKIELVFHKIPLIGKEVDLNELNRVIKIIGEQFAGCLHCVIEDVHAKYGSSAGATFSFGYVCGATEAIIMANNIPHTKVQPKKWQKDMWEGVPVQKKPSSTGKTLVNDTKLMSLMAVKRLFPEIDLRATDRSRKPHDGKVDSLLLAEYGRRNY